jgi:hypothetical protein
MQSDFITLVCPSCGAKISITANAEKYVCDYCGNEHILRKKQEPITPTRPLVPQPANVLIENDKQCVRMVQRWFSLKYIPMAFFAVAWDSFLVFWYSMALKSGAPWIMVVFPLAHVAVGVGITYSTLAGFLNRTTIELNKTELSLFFDPLPWLGETTIKVADIKQFFCKEKQTSSKNGTTKTYELWVVTRDNKQKKLDSGLDNADTALFFEQQLENWLRIEDARVPGELER